jgi:hypothetical protein
MLNVRSCGMSVASHFAVNLRAFLYARRCLVPDARWHEKCLLHSARDRRYPLVD